MAAQEVAEFSRCLTRFHPRIKTFDLLGDALDPALLADFDLALVGGSGRYSAVGDAPWHSSAMASLRALGASGLPVFASCWGFQGLSRAFGGTVRRAKELAEVGTYRVRLTEAGSKDPVFGPAGMVFPVQLGHEDLVQELPPRTTLLARSEAGVMQAFRFEDAPIYCTQFHPELTARSMRERVKAYPRYALEVRGVSLKEFIASLRESPESEALLVRFVERFVRECD